MSSIVLFSINCGILDAEKRDELRFNPDLIDMLDKLLEFPVESLEFDKVFETIQNKYAINPDWVAVEDRLEEPFIIVWDANGWESQVLLRELKIYDKE